MIIGETWRSSGTTMFWSWPGYYQSCPFVCVILLCRDARCGGSDIRHDVLLPYPLLTVINDHFSKSCVFIADDIAIEERNKLINFLISQ
jgi:hypothetical protein